MSSFDDYEMVNQLYKQITDCLGRRPNSDEPVFSINDVKMQIAERLVLKFPILGLEQNKRILLVAVELKLKEMKEVILWDERNRQEAEVESARSESKSLSLLVQLGVISSATRAKADGDDIPF